MPDVLYDAALVPVVVGLVEVCKRLGLPTRFAPVLALVFGVLAKAAQVYLSRANQDILLGGVATGLMAAGLFSGTRAVVRSGDAPRSL